MFFAVFYIKDKKFYFVTKITQQVYVAKDWVKGALSKTRAAFDARSEVEV